MDVFNALDAADQAPASMDNMGGFGFPIDDGANNDMGGLGAADAGLDMGGMGFGGDLPVFDQAPQETQAQESLSLDSFGMGMETAAAPMSHDQPLSLPEVNSSLLNEWESKHTQKLQTKASDAQDKHADVLAKAQSDIEAFYKERAAKVGKNRENNLLEEKNTKTDLESLMAHGTQWEKVARLCETKPIPDVKLQTKERMRKLLVQLKNEKSE